jgi:hypothetical protein
MFLGNFWKKNLNRLEQCLHSAFDPAQYGFTKGSSPEQAHTEYLHFLESNVKGSNGVATIQLDISKAYDRVWHPAVIQNLIQMDTSLYLYKIIDNFLSDRSLSVSYANGFAQKFLSLSVPQGAVLSPFLWNFFITHSLSCLRNTLHPTV